MPICETCLHRVVCGKYTATGGVNKCEHYAEERHENCDWCKPGEEWCGTCVKFFDYYEDGGSDSCSAPFDLAKCSYYKPIHNCPNCGAKMDGGK